MYRFYVRPINRGTVELSGAEAHHLIKVLRLEVGDSVELFDGEGIVAQARISMIERATALLDVSEIPRHEPRPMGRIVLAVSVAKGQRFEWMLSKCTELGADHIIPVIFERTVKRPGGKGTFQRAGQILIAAAKQCGRVFLPALEAPLDLTETLALVQQRYPAGRRLLGMASGPNICQVEPDWSKEDVVAFVGPEGDFTKEETSRLTAAGAIPVSAGATILRVETAAEAFAAILGAQRARFSTE